MDQQDIERIARIAIKELGESSAQMTIAPVAGHPGQWRIDLHNASRGPGSLQIHCSPGTTAQWVREQIFDQMSR
jgi:hypothetical protein